METYTATDDEDDKAGKALIWTLMEGDDALDFKISSAGVLTFAETPNYEAAADTDGNNTYQVTVKATDSSGGDDASATVEVTVNVTNVDEDGTLTLSSRQPVDGIELETELTDIDGTTSDTTWKWEKSTRPDVGLDRHRRGHGGHVHPGTYRRGQLSAGHGDLHRSPGFRQVRDGRLGQEGVGEAEHEQRSRVQERRR